MVGTGWTTEMSAQKILEKAIQKAIAGGWQEEPLRSSDWKVLDEDTVDVLNPDNKHHYLATSDIIFNHDFARALWGDGEYLPTWDDPGERGNWQYHLQMMVIADDPMAYLGANL
jgi:hypothetical protein